MAFYPRAVLVARCSMASSLTSVSAGTLGVRALSHSPDSHVGTDTGSPAQHRSGRAHSEQDLWEEIVRSSLARARKAAPPVKQACSDTNQSPQQTRFLPKGSALESTKDHHPAPPHKSCPTPPATLTSPFPNNSTSHRTTLHKCGIVSWSVLSSLRLEAH